MRFLLGQLTLTLKGNSGVRKDKSVIQAEVTEKALRSERRHKEQQLNT